jgi:hypothetical protein
VKRLLVIMLLCFLIIGISVGQTTVSVGGQGDEWDDFIAATNKTISNYAFFYHQLVKGEGFHNFKQYVATKEHNVSVADLKLENFGHGSGSFDHESQLIAYNRARLTNIIGETTSISNHRIAFNESTDYVYGPTDFYFGKDFKSKPFNSKGKEGTLLRNYPVDATSLENLDLAATDTEKNWVSMGVLFDNSEVYSKDISADLHRRSRTYGVEGDTNYTSLTYSNTSLRIEAAFTGDLHIGAKRLKGRSLIKNPGAENISAGGLIFDNLIDEYYSGTFSITKRMTDTYAVGTTNLEENYLPCCFEGWDTMPPIYQRKFGKDAKGIFDCRCHIGYAYGIDVPLIPKEVQFHNI